MYYFDTNAYWKYYYEQNGAQSLRRLASSSRNQILISRFTVLEFIGVLMKYYRKKLIKRRDINSIIKRMRRDIGTANMHRPFSLVEVSTENFQSAQHILLTSADCNAIQTNDAIHLAIALAAHKKGPEITFVTSDHALKNVVEFNLLCCLDPENPN